MPAGVPANSSYKAYMMGQGPDGRNKTPGWASPIRGIPARRHRPAGPPDRPGQALLYQPGLGAAAPLQRRGRPGRAIAALAMMTGNVGIPGGDTGAREGEVRHPVRAFPTLTNPVKDEISVFMWTDAIVRGTEMTALSDGVHRHGTAEGADQVHLELRRQCADQPALRHQPHGLDPRRRDQVRDDRGHRQPPHPLRPLRRHAVAGARPTSRRTTSPPTRRPARWRMPCSRSG